MTKAQLRELSVQEKLLTMELLWDELCKQDDSVPAPGWHAVVLADREASLAQGDDHFEDWEAVKRNIETDLR